LVSVRQRQWVVNDVQPAAPVHPALTRRCFPQPTLFSPGLLYQRQATQAELLPEEGLYVMDGTSRGTTKPGRKRTGRADETGAPCYTSKIIKAGALLDDTKTLLSHWDVTASVPENLDRIRRENVFGKASRSRVEDILAIFRQRYLTEAEV